MGEADSFFMAPHPEHRAHTMLVLTRQVRGGEYQIAHTFPDDFLIERHRQDQRWAWKTLANIGERLARELDFYLTADRPRALLRRGDGNGSAA